MKRAMIAMLMVVAACGGKKKAKEKAADPGPGTGTGSVVAPVDAAAAEEHTPVDQEVLASNKLVDGLLAGAPYVDGPAFAHDGSRVVWCTAGDNGMADFSEIRCHVVTVGNNKPEVIDLMRYQDAVAIEQGSYPDNSADPKAKAAAAEATKRITDAAAQLKAKAGADLAAPGAPATCEAYPGSPGGGGFAPGTGSDVMVGDDGSCTVDGVNVALAQDGTLTVTAAGKPLLKETFKPRGDGGSHDPGLDCKVEASRAQIVFDRPSKVLALAVSLSNPSDSCAMVTQFEVRALKVP